MLIKCANWLLEENDVNILTFCSSVHLIDYYRKMMNVKKIVLIFGQQGALNWLLQENDRCKKKYC